MSVKQISPRVRLAFVLGLMASTCWLVGCSSDRPTGSASGKVTCSGTPPTAGTVLFSNPETGVGASAELDASGAYKIESIPTGAYHVAIQPPPPPAPHEMEQAAAAPRADIPPKFQDPNTSGLTATVEEGANTKDFAF